MEDKRLEIGIKVSKNTIWGNVLLTIIKIIVGIISKSSAMVADGVHSLSDVLTTIGVMIGLRLSSKEADEDHPYGHERIESLTSLFLSIMLFAVAIGIGYSGINNIIHNNYNTPGKMAIVAAIISILVKELMYKYTKKYAEEIKSESLRADAWHHRSDALSSVGAFIGIIGARIGYKFFDPLVSVIICIVIVKVAYDICKESISQLVDQSAEPVEVENIANRILSVDGVVRIDTLKTRKYANKLYVDVSIAVDSSITVVEGHNIAMTVHNLIEENKDIKHCMVHVNPYFITKRV